MQSKRRSGAGLGVVLGAAVLLAGCNFAKTGAVAPDAPDHVTVLSSVSSGSTDVTLDQATVGTLGSIGVEVKPTGNATVSGGVVHFPITSGYAEVHSRHDAKPGWIQGSLDHSGSGLDITQGSTVVHLTDFVVDPGGSMLYATVDGKPGVPLLFLDGTDVRTSINDAGQLLLDGTVADLTSTAADALDQAFATTAITAGTELGTVHVAVGSGAPLPAGATTFAEAGLTGLTYSAAKDHVTAISRLTGTATTVTLLPAIASALTEAGLAASPSGSATASGTAVTFPITGGFVAIHSNRGFQPGYVVGTVLHQGSGLTIASSLPGGPSITLSNFVVDPGNSVLTGTVGGKSGIPLFFLDGSKLQITPTSGGATLDGTVAELTQPAASALDTTFSTKTFTAGMAIGTVHLVASGS